MISFIYLSSNPFNHSFIFQNFIIYSHPHVSICVHKTNAMKLKNSRRLHSGGKVEALHNY